MYVLGLEVYLLQIQIRFLMLIAMQISYYTAQLENLVKCLPYQ
jgi:hypothetical protein